MKPPRYCLILAGLLLCTAACSSAATAKLELFVSPEGNDAWSGTQPTHPREGTTGPVASLSKALELSRESRKKNPDMAVTISLAGGTYYLSEPVVLTPADSGLRIQAYKAQKPVLSGGVLVTGWRELSADGKRKWAAPLPANLTNSSPHELWVNGKRAVRSRYPNRGYLPVAALPDKTAEWTQGHRRFEFKPGDVALSPSLTNAEAMVMTRWVESRLPVTGIDPDKHLLNFAKRSVFSLDPGDLYYLEGAPEFLDQAGEWCVEPAGYISYLPLPNETIKSVSAVIPALPQVLRFEGDPGSGQLLRDITIEGITFSHTEWCFPRGFASGPHAPTIEPAPDPEVGGFGQAAIGVPAAVWGQGMRNCVFTNCSFANLGTYGLELPAGCVSNRVLRCEFSDLGGGGIKIGETAIRDNPDLVASGNQVADCRIQNGGRMFHSAIGVWIGQSPGNWIQHNEIHDFYYTGISIGWTWGYTKALAANNRVEFNHVHHIGVQSDGDSPILSDMAGIYTLGKQPGTVILNNLWHDIAGIRYGGWGIYFDEGSSGILAASNVVYRTTHGGFHQHYGETNTVRNNIFAFARDYQLQRSRAEAHLSFYFQTNIVYFDNGVLFGSTWDNDQFNLDWNVFFDARTRSGAPINLGTGTWEKWQQRGHDQHSILADPLFASVDKYDFRLNKTSPALGLGFQPIDLSSVGVRKP